MRKSATLPAASPDLAGLQRHPDAAGRLRVGPGPAARQRLGRVVRPGRRQHRAAGSSAPVAWQCSSLGYALSSSASADPTRRSTVPRSGQLEHSAVVVGHHHRARAVPGRLRVDPAARGRLRWRSGSDPLASPRPPRRPHPPLQIQVIAQQWAFTYRCPSYGGVETPQPRDSGEHPGRVPRHLARRDPLVLGVSARREGRREPWPGQHRLRQHEGAVDTSTSTAQSSAVCGTATCTTPAGSCPRLSSLAGSRSSSGSSRRRPRSLRAVFEARTSQHPQRRGG